MNGRELGIRLVVMLDRHNAVVEQHRGQCTVKLVHMACR